MNGIIHWFLLDRAVPSDSSIGEILEHAAATVALDNSKQAQSRLGVLGVLR